MATPDWRAQDSEGARGLIEWERQRADKYFRLLLDTLDLLEQIKPHAPERFHVQIADVQRELDKMLEE